jgi:hypothetical protein
VKVATQKKAEMIPLAEGNAEAKRQGTSGDAQSGIGNNQQRLTLSSLSRSTPPHLNKKR